MSLVTSQKRPDRRMLVPYPVVGAIVLMFLTLTFWVGSAGAENRIFLECDQGGSSYVTQGDMAAGSIGEELASLVGSDDIDKFSNSSLALSYHEAGQSTYSHDGSGAFLYGGLIVVRPVAKSSPLFWKALALGTAWADCTLSFTRQPEGSSTSESYFEIKIESVLITQIEPRAVAQLDAPGTGRAHLEAITFTFRKITWSHVFGGNTFFQIDLETGAPGK